MTKNTLIAALIAFVAMLALPAPASAAPVTDWKEISKTLNTIPTAAKVSVLKRIESCRIIIHKDASWMETRNVAWPQFDAKPGDTVLKLVMDMPPPQQEAGPGPPSEPQKNVTAIWILEKGSPTPLSAWANVLQNRPVPLGYDASNNC